MVGGLVRLAATSERERMAMHSRNVPADLGWRPVLRRTEAAYAAADQIVGPTRSASRAQCGRLAPRRSGGRPGSIARRCSAS